MAAKKAKTKGPSLAVRRACFLEVLRQTANVSRAAREAGLSSWTVYQHRARQPAFARDWDAALAESLDDLESLLIERAKQGVEKPVFFRGEVVGSLRSYSDQLAMFLLRAKRPETYDRLAGGGGLRALPEMDADEAKAEVARRLDRLAESGGDDDAADSE